MSSISSKRAANALAGKVSTTATNKKKKKKSIDLITGHESMSVHFDPKLALDCVSASDSDWLATNLYRPAKVLKEENGILTVQLVSGEVFKMMKNAKEVADDVIEGVEDILKLRDFSEMSLLHTLRVRYLRDDIYTSVGPILISINPYKTISNLYGDEKVNEYRDNNSVRNNFFFQ
jgi:myosin heavy subunit